jgi:hypothetical protein
MQNNKIPKNSYKITVIILSVLTLIFLVMIFFPSIAGIDMMRYGFGISLIAGFLALIFIITLAVYSRMVIRFNKLFSEKNILAHWTYGKNEWQDYISKEFKKQKAEKWTLFILTTVIIFVIGVIFNIIHKDAWIIITIVFLCIIALLAIFALLVPRIQYNKFRKNPSPEVYIGLNGIYLTGEFHLWNFLSSRFAGANLDEKELLVIIQYSYVTRTGINYTNVRIPVSQSNIEEAKTAVQKLNQYNNSSELKNKE